MEKSWKEENVNISDWCGFLNVLDGIQRITTFLRSFLHILQRCWQKKRDFPWRISFMGRGETCRGFTVVFEFSLRISDFSSRMCLSEIRNRTSDIGNPKSDFRKPEPTLLLFDEGQSEMMPQISCPRFSYNQKCSAKMDGCSILAEPRF